MRIFSSKHLSILVVFALLTVLSVSAVVTAQGGEPVGHIDVISRTQAEDGIEFESTRLLVDSMKSLGLDVDHRAIPWSEVVNEIWFERERDDKWQMTAWRMVARPERMDPDEFVFNLFHSSTAESGYNFVGYINEEYDALAEAQRGEIDQEARQNMIYEAQAIVANDVPYVYVAHPSTPQLVRTDIWDANSVVDAQGIGIQNFWTWTNLTPLGDQRTIITNTSFNLVALNPFYIAGDSPSRVTELVWDRLMRLSPEGLSEPWAAESVVWEDSTNVVVTLREGMTWHDGEAVTSEDVKFSYDAALSGESPMYEPFARRVENIEIIDDLTVRFTLNEAWAAFETASLAKLNLVPEHIWGPQIEELLNSEDNAESIQNDVPIGSGPYKMVAFDINEFVILEAFADHFSPPKADGWIMNVLPNAEAALGQMSTGELNFLREWSGDSAILAEIAEADPNIDVYASPDLGFNFFAFNQRVEPFGDVAFRQAIAHVMPQQAIIDNIYKGFAVPADSYVSVAIDYWHNPDLPQYAYDVELAREILAEAGYSWDADGNLLLPEG